MPKKMNADRSKSRTKKPAIETTAETNANLNSDKLEADLNLFLSKVRKAPMHFKDEMVTKIALFKEAFEKFKEKPHARDENFARLSIFLAQVIEFYNKDLGFLVPTITDALDSYGNVMHSFVRMKCVQTLTITSKKCLWDPIESISFLIKLFIIKDKELRTLLTNHIIGEIKKLSEKSKDGTMKRKLLAMFNELLNNSSEKVSKRAALILNELHRKNIWKDRQITNIMADCVFNDYSKVSYISCLFLIETTENFAEVFETSEEEEDIDDIAAKKKKNDKINKPKRKNDKIAKQLKNAKRKQKRRSKANFTRNLFPIDEIYNPQEYCDKLFTKLQKGKDKFDHKLIMMAVISRIIGRHKLIQPNFYQFLQRYLKPGQKECTKVQMYLSEACHPQTPIDSMTPVLKHIIMNFANESCKDDRIVMGLNAICEICKRLPLLMEEDDLNFLAELRWYKDKSVAVSAKALINQFRDLNPYILKKEHRGRDFDKDDKEIGKKTYLYGGDNTMERIEGIEMLENNADIDIECDRVQDEKDFKRIRALQRRKLLEKNLRKQEEDENAPRANYTGQVDMLELVRKEQRKQKYQADKTNTDNFDELDLSQYDEDELMEMISASDLEEGESGEEDEIDLEEIDSEDCEEIDVDDENGGEDGEDDEDEDDDGEEIDLDEIDSDEFEQFAEEGDEDEEGEEVEIEEEEEGNDTELLGKRKRPTTSSGDRPLKKVIKSDKKDAGPESTVNSNSDDSDLADDESSMLDLSDDDEYTKERKNLGFLLESDIYTHRAGRVELRKQAKDEYAEIAETKKMKGKLAAHGQKSNASKLKNKPFQMVIDKKQKRNNEYKQLKVKACKLKNQLGHVHKGMKGNIKSKKRANKK